MREFGASAKVAKALRKGFASVLQFVRDSTIAGRLTGLMKKVNAAGDGQRGQRSFQMLPNSELLEGLEFNRDTPLESIFFAPFDAPSLDANRSVVTLTVPDFDTDSYVRAPEGATHFTLLMASAILSDYEYSTQKRAYEVVNEAQNTVSALTSTDKIALGGLVGQETVLTADLNLAEALPDTAGVCTAVGILFWQEINGQFYELSSDNAMQLLQVA